MEKAKSSYARKHKKIDTDKFEFVWRPMNYKGKHEEYARTVWEAQTYVGPEAYNAGSIEYIIYSNTKNDVSTIIKPDEGIHVCRRLLTTHKVKFIP